jgi:phage recombination protein Bet
MSTTETALAIREEAPLVALGRERLDLIKSTICPKGIPDDAFALFAEQCYRSGLDPLIKQAFCVERKTNIGTKDKPNWVTKYEFQPSEVGMLARAEEFPDFLGCQAAHVRAKDQITIDTATGAIEHRFNPVGDRGRLMGAWGRVTRRDRAPIVVWLDYESYSQDNSMWSKKGATMIEKCARVAVLRKAYPAKFGGLYIAEEQSTLTVEGAPDAPASPSSKLLDRVREANPQVAEVMDAFMPREPETIDADEAAERIKAEEPDERTEIGETEAEDMARFIEHDYAALKHVKKTPAEIAEAICAKYGVPDLRFLAPADAREAIGEMQALIVKAKRSK